MKLYFLKIKFKLYDSQWNIIKMAEGLIQVDRRWSNIGKKLKDAIVPLLKEIRDAANNKAQEEKNSRSSKGRKEVDQA